MKKQAQTISKKISKKQDDSANIAVTNATTKKIKRGTIHSNYREIEVIQTDGTTFKVRSTYKNLTLRLDTDIKTHPAWTKEANYVNTQNSEVAKFNNRFAGISFGLKK